MAVTLTEQMGAMSLIDDMRHKQMLVQEHLNLPERRREVAQRIRDYYASKSIETDTDMVDKGVADYFSKRLTYEAGAGNKFKELIAGAYVTRNKWLSKVIIGAIVLGGTATVMVKSIDYMDNQKTVIIQAHADQNMALAKQLMASIQTQYDKAQELEKKSKAANLMPGMRMIDAATQTLLDASSYTKNVLKLPAVHVTKQTRDDDVNTNKLAADGVKQTGVELGKATTLIQSVESLLAINKEYVDTVTAGDFATKQEKYPQLKNASAEASKAIDTADTTGVQPANKAVNQLVEAIAGVGKVDALSEREARFESQFKSMNLSSEDSSIVSVKTTRVKNSISNLDIVGAEAGLGDLDKTLQFAKTPLKLNIVDRANAKSGVERKYNDSGGKSWFLVVEATDPSGNVVPVPVKSLESGRESYASMFGVRVSQDEYNKVKANKKANGHVDNRAMGEKSANSLTLKFNQRTAAKPDMITEW